MGLFDLFTGNAAKKAAEQQRQFLQQQQQQVSGLVGGATNQGINAIQSGVQNAVGAIQPAIDTGRADISSSIQPALDALTGYSTLGAEALSGGVGGATDALSGSLERSLGLLGGANADAVNAIRSGTSSAVGAFNPLDQIGATYGDRATRASSAIEDALGLSGPEGAARARAAFQTGPAYEFNLNQGLDAINRARAARGELSGGNIDRDTQQFGSGLASREWSDYINRLTGREAAYLPFEPQLASTAATGRAGAFQTGAGREADLLNSLGLNSANLVSNTGRSIADTLSTGGARMADLFGRTGSSISDVYTGGGRNLAELAARGGLAEGGIQATGGSNIADLVKGLTGTQIGYLGNTADDYANTYAQEANASMQGLNNLFNLVGQGVKFATGQGWFGLTPPK